jgi:Ring finger domain
MDARKDRALTQRLYLLSSNKISEESWTYEVEGSTGNHYNVSFEYDKVRCTCFDFCTRHRNCKHIYFIVGKVLGKMDLLEILDSNPNFDVFKSRISFESRNFFSEDNGGTCSICFEDYVKGDKLTKCRVCKQCFHNQCIKVWLKHKSSCPLCRGNWGI